MGSETGDVASKGRPRLRHLDMLRAVALIAVLAGHVWYVEKDCIGQTCAGWTNRLIYSWHVPMFFVLSGLLWRPGRTARAELRHRWRVLVVPYVAWWLLVLAAGIGYLLAHGDGIDPFWVVSSAYGGAAALRPFTAFWFFSAFLVALLTLRLCERFPRWVSWAVAVAGIAACLVASQAMRLLPMALGTGVGCTFFLLFGQELGRFASRAGAAWWGVAGVVLGFGLVALPWYRPLELKHALYGVPVLSVLAACLITGGLVLVSPALAAWLPDVVIAACAWLSSLAVPIMLGQGIFLMLLDTPVEGGWSDFALAGTGSIVLAWLLRKSPVGNWFCGPAKQAEARVRTGLA